MATSAGFQVCGLAGRLNADGFWELVSTGFWNGLVVSNRLAGAVDLALRTDVDDPNTEIVIPAGGEFVVPAVANGVQPRFPANKTACFLKPVSGDGSGAYVMWM